ncbi:MAG: HAD family acid phosphatase [Myxococcota bacterium]
MSNTPSSDPASDSGSDPVWGPLDLRRGPRAHALLQQVVDRVRARPELVVFDLDSTLLDNKTRQALIMAEYGRAHGVDALAATRSEHWDGWDYRAAMRNAGLPADQVEDHVEAYRAWWREHFFTSEYCRIDEAVPGAVAYVSALGALGARIYYVTGRQQSMRAGTEESFERLGFARPNGNDVQLWMKPALEEEDDAFKARVHEKLKTQGPPVAVFDNEPTHVNDYRRSFPDARVIHLATDHSRRPVRVDPQIPSIPDFSAWDPGA